jgi:hypothetical protein
MTERLLQGVGERASFLISGKIYAEPKTHQFLLEAITESAHLKSPKDARVAKNWGKWLEIAFGYFFSDSSYSDLARKYGYTSRQRPQQITLCVFNELYANCSPALQARFPREELKVGKPYEGKRRKIIKAPPGQREQNRKLLERAKLASTKSDTEVVLSQVTGSYMQRHPEAFVSLYNAARRAQFRFDKHNLGHFLRVLREHGEPFREYSLTVRTKKGRKAVHYCFILKGQEESVREIFDSCQELARFKTLCSTRQIAGPSSEIPSTWLLKKRRGYCPIHLMELQRRGLSKADILTKSPVAVFVSSGVHLIRESDRELFGKWIEAQVA